MKKIAIITDSTSDLSKEMLEKYEIDVIPLHIRLGEEIAEQILNMQEKVRASFVVDTLTYLHRGGRCSGVAAMAGGALKLHPYISVAEGKMQPGKKYRGKMQKVILDYVEDLKPDLLNAKADNLFITHSGCEEEILEMVQEELKQLQYFKNIYVTRAGGVISSHCGPGTLGVLFIQK